jgi:hypothetical protein
MPLLVTIFLASVLSASLLFMVQPMFARMALPLFGGSPQVWVTCMLFFQVTLLIGYGYTHGLSKIRSVRSQTLLHAAVLLTPVAFLPFALDQLPGDGADKLQQLRLLSVLALTVGIPFFAVSTTGPLMQRWLSLSHHRHANDPYFLYAAGNAGSLAGLLAYPLIMETNLTLTGQRTLWAQAYYVLVFLSLAAAWLVTRNSAPSAPIDRMASGDSEPIGTRRKLRWVTLAFIPSSLMLGVTTHITTEVAVVPLLWVIPLALYLVSFMLTFARQGPRPLQWFSRLLPPAALILMLILVSGATEPMPLIMALNLGFFFVAAMVCHGELARDRPAVRHLTLFYLALAIGGALGGVFNALIAPWLFNGIHEYPLMIILATLACPPRNPTVATKPSWKDLTPAALVAAMIGCFWLLADPVMRIAGLDGPEFDLVKTAIVLAIPLIVSYLFVQHPRKFAAALGAWSVMAYAIYENNRGTLLYADRSFFGVHRVNVHPQQQARTLRHGFTMHGMQKLAPELREVATTYYHRSGPAGQLFERYHSKLNTVGIVGLGAGTQAVFARPGQSFVFFEIDPAVADIADNPTLFSFIADARARGATVEIRLGDARLTLERESELRFDLLIVDAFSNDSIPVHLMTREAIQLYLEKLPDDGLLLFHVSNRHFAVERPLSDLADALGLFALYQDNPVESAREHAEGKSRSQWVLMAKEPGVLRLAESAGRWQVLAPAGDRVWTDDYANVMNLLFARAMHASP